MSEEQVDDSRRRARSGSNRWDGRTLSRRGALAGVGVGLFGSLVGFSRIASADDFAGGIGTESSPYEIETWEHLHNIGFEEDYFILNNDLDDDTDGYGEYVTDDDNGWNPINFEGTLDGDGHTISELVISRGDQGGDNIVGLFQNAGGSTIENLTVSGNVTGQRTVGMIAGRGGLTIRNCSVAGSVEATDADAFSSLQAQHAGGLVGIFDGGTITNCDSSASVTGDITVGGLVGAVNSGTIRASYATGPVLGSMSFLGGLVGDNRGTIEQCYATGSVQGQTSDGSTGVGGLVGQNRTSSLSDGVIRNCYATGSASATGLAVGLDGPQYVGALVGENSGGAEIIKSYASGTAGSTSINAAGGIVGLNDGQVWDVYYNSVNDSAFGDNSGRGVLAARTVANMQGASAEDSLGGGISSSTTRFTNGLDFRGVWTTVTDPDEFPTLQVFVDDSEDSGLDPIGSFENAPQDLNGDGLCEDVNGDGQLTTDDVQALQQHLDDDVVTNNPEKFNFSGNDPTQVTDADVQALYDEVTGGE